MCIHAFLLICIFVTINNQHSSTLSRQFSIPARGSVQHLLSHPQGTTATKTLHTHLITSSCTRTLTFIQQENKTFHSKHTDFKNNPLTTGSITTLFLFVFEVSFIYLALKRFYLITTMALINCVDCAPLQYVSQKWIKNASTGFFFQVHKTKLK